jgi:hypothetical protein
VVDEVLAIVTDHLAREPERLRPLVRQVLADVAADHGAVEPLVDTVLTGVTDDPESLLALITRVLDPVVDQAVPEAIDRLTAEPDDIRALIWDQSGGLADEMANSFRARLVSADDGINGLTDRLLGRRWRDRRRARRRPPTSAGPGGTP